MTFGSIAQLGEHLPYKQRVIGSSPIVPTNTLRFVRRVFFCVRVSKSTILSEKIVGSSGIVLKMLDFRTLV